LLALAERQPPEPVVALIGTYLELARLLGQRTGEMHLALASDHERREFAPEPFTLFYQRARFQSMRNLAVQNLQSLRRHLPTLAEPVRAQAQKVAALEPDILKRLRALHERPINAQRIRVHGDFHLGQVLYTGKDFLITDFEGEPERPLGERRLKRSPLRDVAAMIRSFDYVTRAALFKQLELGTLQEKDLQLLDPWAQLWYRWVSAAYFKAYVAAVREANLVPASTEQLAVLIEAHLFEKALYEIGYELQHRLKWLQIPLQALLQLLEQEHKP
jgi:maltose alpha-D-glucosyltransferase / alpha-amylase